MVRIPLWLFSCHPMATMYGKRLVSTLPHENLMGSGVETKLSVGPEDVLGGKWEEEEEGSSTPGTPGAFSAG